MLWHFPKKLMALIQLAITTVSFKKVIPNCRVFAFSKGLKRCRAFLHSPHNLCHTWNMVHYLLLIKIKIKIKRKSISLDIPVCCPSIVMIRGVEWSHSIGNCSQDLAFARIARKNYMSDRLLVLANFCSDFR